MQSYENPRGLLKLTARMHLGNIFADFTWEVIELANEVEVSFLLLEQTEDLKTNQARFGVPYPKPRDDWLLLLAAFLL